MELTPEQTARKADIETALNSGTLTPAEQTALVAEYDAIDEAANSADFEEFPSRVSREPQQRATPYSDPGPYSNTGMPRYSPAEDARKTQESAARDAAADSGVDEKAKSDTEGVLGALFAFGAKALKKPLGVKEEVGKRSLGDSVVMGTIRYYRNLTRHLDAGTLGKEGVADIKNAVARIRDAQLRLDDYSTGIYITLGAATGNIEQLIIERHIIDNARGSTAANISATNLQNDINSIHILKGIADDVAPVPILPNREADPLVDQVHEVLTSPLRQAKAIIEKDEIGVADMGEALEKFSHTAGPSAAQAVSASGAAAARNVEGITWDAFRKSVLYDYDTGESAIQLMLGDTSAMKTVLNTMAAQAQESFIKQYADAKRTLIRSIGREVTTDDKVVREMGESVGGEELHILRSFLTTAKSKITSGAPNAPGYQVKDLDRMISAIDADLAAGSWKNINTGAVLDNTGPQARNIRAWFEEGSTATKTRERVYKNKVAQKILKVDNQGELVTKEEALQDIIFKPKNSYPLEQTLAAAGNAPSMRRGLLESLEKKYHQEVYKDAVPSTKAHNVFISNYGRHIDLLLRTGKKEAPAVSELQHSGDLLKAVDVAKKVATEVEDELKKRFGDALVGGKVTTGGLSAALNKMAPAEIKRAMLALDGSPGLKQAVQRDYLDNLLNQLTSKGGKELNISSINKVIGTKNEREVMTEVLGKKYVQNLTDLRTLVHASNAHKR